MFARTCQKHLRAEIFLTPLSLLDFSIKARSFPRALLSRLKMFSIRVNYVARIGCDDTRTDSRTRIARSEKITDKSGGEPVERKRRFTAKLFPPRRGEVFVASENAREPTLCSYACRNRLPGRTCSRTCNKSASSLPPPSFPPLDNSQCLRNTRRISNTARPSVRERLMDSGEIILAEYQMSGKGSYNSDSWVLGVPI